MSWEPRDLPENNVSPTHPLAELGTLVGGILLVTVVLTVGFTFGVEIAIGYVPPSLEARWFGSLWDTMEDGNAPADVEAEDGEAEVDPARLAAARALLQRMAAHWEENPYELRLGVMPGEPNAFALPGGAIFVTEGLLDQVGSENELAFVLAHEIGHFRGRDHLRSIGRALAVGIALSALTGGALGGDLPTLAAEMTQLGFAREQESDADRFALELLRAEYGHVDGAGDFFRKLPDAGGGSGARAASWFATHPVTSDRIEALGTWAREQGYRQRGRLTALDPSFHGG